MSRGLSATITTELAKAGIQVAFLVEINVLSGPIRVWSGYGTLNYATFDWYGVGTLGKISAMPETSQVQAQGCTLTLSGIPSDMLGYALTEIRQGKTANIWLAFLDTAGAVLDVSAAYAGRVDACSISEGGDTSSITLSIENELITLQRPRVRYYTPDDQKMDYPDDQGFDFVAALQELNLVWGQGNQQIPISPPANSGWPPPTFPTSPDAPPTMDPPGWGQPPQH